MQSMLDKNGKLIREPKNIAEAQYKVRGLDREISRIRRTIFDPNRAMRYKTEDEYKDWRRRACRVLDDFIAERVLTGAWLERELTKLLHNARDLFVKMRDEDDVEFYEDERELVRKIERACAKDEASENSDSRAA